MDVTNQVDVTRPEAVCRAVRAIVAKRYPGRPLAVIDRLFEDFRRLYSGEYPGFYACDTNYHDMQHVLDVTLAAARLLDGYDADHTGDQRLGLDLTVVGIAVALYHDSGYIRRKGDTRHQHGAEYTKVHVSRSARFLREYLPDIGWQWAAPLAAKLVHFTGYEYAPEQISLEEPRHRTLGALIGTADVIAQMADRAYLKKCRDSLFPEFVLGGVARQLSEDGRERVIYASPEDLLVKTPDFIQRTIEERLDAQFGGVYRYAAVHFAGRNLYMDALHNNLAYLKALLEQEDIARLSSDQLHVS